RSRPAEPASATARPAGRRDHLRGRATRTVSPALAPPAGPSGTRDHSSENGLPLVDSHLMAGAFEGKTGLILGVANKRSIAWSIAKRLAEGGATLAFTYQGERIEGSVRELAEQVSSPLVTECDVRSDDNVARVFGEVGDAF